MVHQERAGDKVRIAVKNFWSSMTFAWAAFWLLLISDQGFRFAFGLEHNGREHFLNEWSVEVKGGRRHAEEVAAQHGYRVERESITFPDHYVFARSDVPHRSKRGAHHHTRKLTDDFRVKYAAQQTQKHRVKRDVAIYNRELAQSLARSNSRLNDPQYVHQWYLNPVNASQSDSVKFDLGVLEAWKKGYSGRGVVVTILDDGIERTHPDLEANYDPKASYDLNGNDPDPSPRYEETNENKHGTRCGGEVAMVANNNLCGVGIAFNARIGGVRMLDGKVTDRLEGDAIGFGSDHVDISSASWGPNDNGKTLEKAGVMASKGILKAVKEGRKGKGTILVWAAGNGAGRDDHCNADGYTSSIYTLSVSSTTQRCYIPWYSERCASTLSTTYSSGTHHEGKVISADLHGECTNQHTGTSASAPMAAGILALVLEANPELTWRDVQHLVVLTSRMDPLAYQDGWYENGAGYCVNLAFGFGLMNAEALVEMANPKVWEMVGEQHTCSIKPGKNVTFPQVLTSGSQIDVEIYTDGCKNQENEINYLENVQVIFDLKYQRRGNVYAELESPSGTITPLFLERSHDASTAGFDKWPLTSTHTWGEKPQGRWIFRVADRTGSKLKGFLESIALILYGTKEQPFYHKFGKKDCHGVGKFSNVALQNDVKKQRVSAYDRLMESIKIRIKHKAS